MKHKLLRLRPLPLQEAPAVPSPWQNAAEKGMGDTDEADIRPDWQSEFGKDDAV